MLGEGSIALPAHSRVRLAPVGSHIMLASPEEGPPAWHCAQHRQNSRVDISYIDREML